MQLDLLCCELWKRQTCMIKSFLQSSLSMLLLLTKDFLSLLEFNSIVIGDLIAGEKADGYGNALGEVCCLLINELTRFLSLIVLQLRLDDLGVDCNTKDLFNRNVLPFDVTHICVVCGDIYFFYCKEPLLKLLIWGENFICMTPNSEAFDCNAEGCQNEAEEKDENELNGETSSWLVLFSLCVFFTNRLLWLLLLLFVLASPTPSHDCATL